MAAMRLLQLSSVAFTLCLCLCGLHAKAEVPLEEIKLPANFSISIFAGAGSVPGARMLELSRAEESDNVTIFVSTTSDKVYSLRSSKDGNVSVCTLLSGQDKPHGLAYRNGSLYVASWGTVTRWDNVDAAAEACDPKLLNSTKLTDLYENPGHNNRAFVIGPDDKMYVGMGSEGNTDCTTNVSCAILRFNLDGSGEDIYARSIRNPAGLAVHPATGRLWFTGMGSDGLGDNRPDDTLNSPDGAGQDYHFPACQWEGSGDPELRDVGASNALATMDPDNSAANAACAANATNATRPVQALGPHVAPIGLSLYPQSDDASLAAGARPFPAPWQGGWFIAERGSWNRGQKIGYRIAHVALDASGTQPTNHTVFASGWLQELDQSVWGRPVDTLVLPDGSLLVSDEMAGAVYHISYDGEAKPSPSPDGFARSLSKAHSTG